MDVLAKHGFHEIGRVEKGPVTAVDFSNGKFGVELIDNPVDEKRMFLMEADRLEEHHPFTLVVAYLRGAADPIVEPLDSLARFFDEHYSRIARLFSKHGGADREGLEEHDRLWHLRMFGLDLRKKPR
jgi:hypothetical protein